MVRRWRAFWNNVVHSTRLEEELNEELDAYAELVAADKMRSGIARDEAERQTRREMGGVEQIREAVRDVRVGVSLERLAQDIRVGARTLSKNRAFSLVAIATLALGIGANTAMFSVVDQILLRLLPVKQPEFLVKVTVLGNNFGDSYGADRLSWPMFEDLRNRNEVFSGMFCRFPATVAIGYGDRTAQVRAELVSGSYFSVLGVGAAIGRTIGADDDKVPDSHPVVVLSDSFWRNSFNADRTIVGRPVVLNGHNMTVIGVAQPGFDGLELGSPAQMFVPIMMKTEMTPHSDGLKDGRRRLAWVAAYGRLKSGIDARQAQRSLQPLLHGILAEKCSCRTSARSPFRIVSSSCAIRLHCCQDPTVRCATLCGGRSGSCLRLREPSCCSPARTSPISCWHARRLANERSPCALPLARRDAASFGS